MTKNHIDKLLLVVGLICALLMLVFEELAGFESSY